MSTLTISLLQADLAWHDAARNRDVFAQRIADLPPTDVIVLPEMFSTGFSMAAAELAEPMDGHSVEWMRETARAHGAVICGSLIVCEGEHCFNRFIWMPPDGTPVCYDKRHLFRMAGEDGPYTAGRERRIIEFGAWRILPVICYDLRFPVWTRSVDTDYDLMICVANWPTPRRTAWQTLLRARAIENVCYVAGVNRVGEDGNGVRYGGDSALIDHLGQTLASLAEVPGEVTLPLERRPLERFREKFPVHLDADRFTLDSAP